MFVDEVSKYDFGDGRLWQRFLKIGKEISHCMSSIITACFNSKTERAGAYRFFSNEKINAQAILASHKPVLTNRVNDHSEVTLMIHDTSTFSYSTHPCTKNLGRVGTHNSPGHGINVHTSLCLSADQNKPLGIAYQTYYYHQDSEKTRERLIEEKESYRWIEHLKQAHQVSSNAIHVCDREGDIFELFQEAIVLDARVIIRQNQDRALGETMWGKKEGTILERLEQTESSGTYDVKTHDQTLTLDLKYAAFRVAPPKRTLEQKKQRPYQALDLTAVQVSGLSHKGEKISWNLLVNFPVNGFEEAKQIVAWYTQRWHIELFHKALKSGFSLEDARLEDGNKLKSLIALISIEAARVYSLLYSGRLSKAPSPTIFFDQDELAALKILMKAQKKNVTDPSLSELIEFIGMQGGFSKTKKFPFPGILTFFRGWIRIMDQIAAIKLVWNR